jgi:hypothetical protein
VVLCAGTGQEHSYRAPALHTYANERNSNIYESFQINNIFSQRDTELKVSRQSLARSCLMPITSVKSALGGVEAIVRRSIKRRRGGNVRRYCVEWARGGVEA